LEFMLKSPVSVWWAAATFAIEVLSFVFSGDTIQVSRL